MNRSTKLTTLFAAAVLLVSTTQSQATVYNPTTDFSIASTPNGVWSYGFYNAAGNAYTAFTLPQATSTWHGNSELDAWTQGAYDSSAYSVVGKNVSGSLQFEAPGGSIAVDPQTLFFHPGNSGEKPTIRFTAPSEGTIDINAIFSATDTSGGDRDVHVYVNGTDLYSAAVVGSKTSATPANAVLSGISLLAGDTIDLAVGYGSDGVYYNDATALSASLTFTPVPEPTTLALFGLGSVSLLLAARRRRA